jgi:membrane-bound metal-dependent hydrolase YbcI (DUF457 family)
MLSLAGGYILVKGMRLDYKIWTVILLALLSVLIDEDHFWFQRLYLHNIFIVTALALATLAFYLMKQEKAKGYAMILTVMVIGHLLVDMSYGQGLHLMYPLSRDLYVLPQIGVGVNKDLQVEVAKSSSLTECIITPTGVVLAAYFGLIFAMIAAKKFQ